MKKVFKHLILFCTVSFSFSQAGASDQAELNGLNFPEIDIEKFGIERYELENGMIVLLYQDKSTPIAFINQWYRGRSNAGNKR